ncbi:hypothetical protein F4778DRAFT_737027 [Xylariomycetidae sp. FL2044]|nr:hypothetical protein F4778DRAFT_737027 [Xylariomycetidae sp. FL2044]
MNNQDLTQTLIESFTALADEVQNLSDRQTILEHKLRYAYEQFQCLADKYSAPEIPETLINLQIPPELHSPSLVNTSFVPLPKRTATDSKHQIAVIIREGRRVASTLSDFSKSSQSSRSRDSLDPTANSTASSMSTVLEQDFTVEGKKGSLACPFSSPRAVPPADGRQNGEDNAAPHDSDPICAALHEEETGSQAAATKCPIRYLDQHSPEEIAEYVEKHKHELPRSHEVCVRRYQRNEEHIRKLDAKYGNLVSMVEGLSKIHQPMLPEQDTRPQSDVERVSNERVENWAKTVTAAETDDPDRTALEHVETDEDRQSHFDRPLKEVRVGESPSRPWGISVPIFDTPSSESGSQMRPESPPPAPVHMPASMRDLETPAKKTGKCPFDHQKLSQMMNGSTPLKRDEKSSIGLDNSSQHDRPSSPAQPPQASSPPSRPAFVNASGVAYPKQGSAPQMLFTGPVFIGYPIEQAIQFMQHYQGQN